MKLIINAGAIFDRGILTLAVVAGVTIVFIWGIIFTEVVLRFLTGYSMIWVVKICESCIFVATFLCAAWLLKKEGHIKIDIVYSRLKPRAQVFLNIITSIIGAVICLFLVWYGTKVTIEYIQSGIISWDVLKIVVWPRYAIIALGSLTLLVQFCRRTYGNLMLWRMPEGEEILVSEEKTDY